LEGFLKLSFVSCQVSLYPAIAAEERLSFHRVNRRTGNRLRQKLVHEVTGEPVQSEERGRSYQIGEDQLLIVQEDELDAAEEEARNRPFFP
jgi:DNA end-binding protein Ku